MDIFGALQKLISQSGSSPEAIRTGQYGHITLEWNTVRNSIIKINCNVADVLRDIMGVEPSPESLQVANEMVNLIIFQIVTAFEDAKQQVANDLASLEMLNQPTAPYPAQGFAPLPNYGNYSNNTDSENTGSNGGSANAANW